MPVDDVQEREWWVSIAALQGNDHPVEPEYYYYVVALEDDSIELRNPISGTFIESWSGFYDMYVYAPWYVPSNEPSISSNFEPSTGIMPSNLEQAVLAILGLTREDLNILREQARHPLRTTTTPDTTAFTPRQINELRDLVLAWVAHPDVRESPAQVSPTSEFTREQFDVVRQQIESWSPHIISQSIQPIDRGFFEAGEMLATEEDREMQEETRVRETLYRSLRIPDSYLDPNNLETVTQEQIFQATRDRGLQSIWGSAEEQSNALMNTIATMKNFGRRPEGSQSKDVPEVKTIWERLLEDK